MIGHLLWKIYGQNLSDFTVAVTAAVLLWGLVMAWLPGLRRGVNWIIWIVSLLAILQLTLGRNGGKRELILIPLRFLEEAKIQPELYRSVLMNLFLFVPFGMSIPFLLPKHCNGKIWKTIFAAAALSVCIEALQFYWELGRSELDDVLMNTLGAWEGTISFWLAEQFRSRQQPIRVTEYVLENAPFNLRIGLAADLHERNGKKVLELLKKEKPDIVCFAGDTFERRYRQNDYEGVEHLPLAQRVLVYIAFWLNDRMYRLRGISRNTSVQEIYALLEGIEVPGFLSLGNHDPALTETDRETLIRAKVTLLDNSHSSFCWKGQEIQIGGLSSEPDLDWLETFAEQPGYKLLLCHHPDYYPLYIKEKNIDLTLSGHVHGGQIRIAGHGIFAPGQGLFPKYHHGIYHGKLVVSAGCSDTTALPRWGNPCELVIIQLRKG